MLACGIWRTKDGTAAAILYPYRAPLANSRADGDLRSRILGLTLWSNGDAHLFRESTQSLFCVLITELDDSVVLTSGDVGDVNCDGSVNAIDAALFLQFNAGLVGSLPCEDAADVNSDGDITSVDAALILQFTAGLISSLPP